MKPVSSIGLLIAATLMTSCMNVRMYEGPEKTVSEIGRFFAPGRRNLRIDSLDEKPTTAAGTVLQIAPGTRTLDVYASNYQVSGYFTPTAGMVITSESANYDEGMYRIEVPVRAGHTYVIDYPHNFSGPLPDKLCVIGEPHKATGSSEDFYRVTRTMSPSAEIVACGPVRDKRSVSKKS
jgi:hypothetical protein